MTGAAGGPVAAIDIGSISVRLLIVDGVGNRLASRTEIVNLSSGLAATRMVADDRAAALVDVLADYRTLLAEHDVTAARAVATQTLRRAGNAPSVLDAAEVALGIRPEVIDAQEEGRLAFAGATADLDPDLGPFLVIDLGGASTEFAIGGEACEAVWSIDLGARTATERYIESDPPRPEELVAVLSVTEAHMDDVRRELPGFDSVKTRIGLAGTITTAAAVEIGLVDYDRDAIHHFVLERSAAEDVYRTLVTEPLADRLHNPGLRPERAEAIIGGITELVSIMRFLVIDELVVSESDLLDGVTAQLRASAGG